MRRPFGPNAVTGVTSGEVRRILGGSLRPDDPRRFLVEIMVGAMQADGAVDERERAALRRLLGEHDLFASLSGHAAETLIELATDNMAFALDVGQRVERVAQKLPPRVYRLAAYAMACEIVAADEVLKEGERRYLSLVRRVFAIGEPAHDELLSAARSRRAMAALELRTDRLRQMLPLVLRACFSRRAGAGRLRDLDWLRGVLGAIPDLAQDTRAFEEALTGASAPPDDEAAAAQVTAEVAALSDPTDQYWLVVYLLAVDAARDCTGWRETQFFPALRQALAWSDAQMDQAERHAGHLAAWSQSHRGG